MKAVIYLDVPNYQISQEVTVYFKDTMMKRGVCEAVEEQINAKDETSKEEEIALLNYRLNWINEHEKMFEITSIMNLERVLLMERLEELQKDD